MELDFSKCVQVSNISPNANEKTVSDFFSFCGKITKLYLKKEEQGTQSAVVQFETESASKTALLLTNALIVDRPIIVAPINAPKQQTQTEVNTSTNNNQPEIHTPGTPVPESNITQRDFGGVTDENRSKTSVVASLLAAGYVLADDALNAAKEIDEKNSISLNVKVAVEQLKVKAHEIDKQYGISEKATSIKNQVSEKAKQLDQEYKISELVTGAAKSVQQTVSNTTQAAVNKAQQYTSVQHGVETVKTQANKVNSLVDEIKAETNKQIEEKRRERSSSKSDGVTQTVDTTTTTATTTPSQPQTNQNTPQ